MTIQPLRNMVVMQLRPPQANGGRIQVISDRKAAVREAEVLAIGPECRDVQIGDTVLINLLVTSQVGESYLIAEPHILGTLP